MLKSENLLQLQTWVSRRRDTTIHHLEFVANQLAEIGIDRHVQIRFEDMIEKPTDCVEQVSSWLGLIPEKNALERVIDPKRIQKSKVIYPPDVAEEVKDVLHSLRMDYGYILR